jgi:hypothetical protein
VLAFLYAVTGNKTIGEFIVTQRLSFSELLSCDYCCVLVYLKYSLINLSWPLDFDLIGNLIQSVPTYLPYIS